MALFELDQEFGTGPEEEWKPPTFKDCAAADIDLAFFQENEHAEWHTVDGKKALIILESGQLKVNLNGSNAFRMRFCHESAALTTGKRTKLVERP